MKERGRKGSRKAKSEKGEAECRNDRTAELRGGAWRERVGRFHIEEERGKKWFESTHHRRNGRAAELQNGGAAELQNDRAAERRDDRAWRSEKMRVMVKGGDQRSYGVAEFFLSRRCKD
jgi:hypothetical protein